MSDSLWPHELQHARVPYPSLAPRVCSNSRPLNHLILCCPIHLPSSIFPSIRVFSNESALHVRWSKYWSFSISNSPSNEHSGLTGWISLLSKGLSRVFSSNTVWKHRFFSSQLSLWSNSHIHIRLLEKPQLWLYGPLSAKWCLCFLNMLV